ncbi:MAG: TIGR03621 family F420-dependent LLM class oxidoreductase [Chloroflexi bacterium]|nr:MAG: TIGR03621 family F420-dependent LLM class oxidoreductase [Chloroflexota bacterium]
MCRGRGIFLSFFLGRLHQAAERAHVPKLALVPRPFRFAVTARWPKNGPHWRDVARRAEDLGYDVLLVTDHMGKQLAPIPALMAAADATTRLRVGSFVFANDYRNPVMLAKEVATLDLLSGGRVEVGIGAGWSAFDYRELGISYDAPGVRVSRLEESVVLLKRLLSEESVDFTGKHYAVRGAKVLPRPIQRPHPPLMIGGGGPRVMRLAARHADIVTFAPQTSVRGRARLDAIRENALAERVTQFRAAAGARADSIELNVFVFDAAVTDRAPSLMDAVSAQLRRAANGIVRSPFVLYGSRSSLRELLIERRERLGISYISVPGNAMREFAPIVEELRGT